MAPTPYPTPWLLRKPHTGLDAGYLALPTYTRGWRCASISERRLCRTYAYPLSEDERRGDRRRREGMNRSTRHSPLQRRAGGTNTAHYRRALRVETANTITKAENKQNIQGKRLLRRRWTREGSAAISGSRDKGATGEGPFLFVFFVTAGRFGCGGQRMGAGEENQVFARVFKDAADDVMGHVRGTGDCRLAPLVEAAWREERAGGVCVSRLSPRSRLGPRAARERFDLP